MDEQEPESVGIDIARLDELLQMLRQNDVHSFQAGGITVVFNEKEAYQGIAPTAVDVMEDDDGHSTSNKRVSGFRDPALWKYQNGKVLTFKGSLE